jgi:hypothetical protein
MRYFAYLFLTALVMAGPAIEAAPAAASDVRLDASTSVDAASVVVATDSRWGSGSLRGNHHFRNPGFSHDRHFSGQDRFHGSHRHFRGQDRHLFDKDHRHFGAHDHKRYFPDPRHRHFIDRERHFLDRRERLFPDHQPRFKGYAPGNDIQVCYRSGTVLVCYGG